MWVCNECGEIHDEYGDGVCCGVDRRTLEDAVNSQLALFEKSDNERAARIMRSLKWQYQAANEAVDKAKKKVVSLERDRELALALLLDFSKLEGGVKDTEPTEEPTEEYTVEEVVEEPVEEPAPACVYLDDHGQNCSWSEGDDSPDDDVERCPECPAPATEQGSDDTERSCGCPEDGHLADCPILDRETEPDPGDPEDQVPFEPDAEEVADAEESVPELAEWPMGEAEEQLALADVSLSVLYGSEAEILAAKTLRSTEPVVTTAKAGRVITAVKEGALVLEVQDVPEDMALATAAVFFANALGIENVQRIGTCAWSATIVKQPVDADA